MQLAHMVLVLVPMHILILTLIKELHTGSYCFCFRCLCDNFFGDGGGNTDDDHEKIPTMVDDDDGDLPTSTTASPLIKTDLVSTIIAKKKTILRWHFAINIFILYHFYLHDENDD